MSFPILPDAFDVGNMLLVQNNRPEQPEGTHGPGNNFEKPNRERYQQMCGAVNTATVKEWVYAGWREYQQDER